MCVCVCVCVCLGVYDMHACMYVCMYAYVYVFYKYVQELSYLCRNSVLAEALGVLAQGDDDWAGEDAFCDTIAEVCACDQ